MGKYGDEMVWVVKREILFPQDAPQGLIKDNALELVARMKNDGFYAPREEVETDSSLQQVIPYLVFSHEDKVYMTQRLGAGTEVRLHNRYSLGVGGHINPGDEDAGDIVAAGMAREWEEEIVYSGTYKETLLGIINDDSNEVGSVHVGLVYLLKGDSKEITPRELDRQVGTLVSLSEVRNHFEELEGWSQLILAEVEHQLGMIRET